MSHKLLIVDDSKGCSEMYKMRFEYDKWDVRIAFSAEIAIKMLKDGNYKPDAILLDLMLPEMQGDELLDVLKGDPKTKNIKVIVITALNLDGKREKVLTNKADDYIPKISIMPYELVKRVTALVEGDNI